MTGRGENLRDSLQGGSQVVTRGAEQDTGAGQRGTDRDSHPEWPGAPLPFPTEADHPCSTQRGAVSHQSLRPQMLAC